MNRRMFTMHSCLAGAALLLSPAATAGDEIKDEKNMKHTIDNLMMFSLAVSDMREAKAFYVDKLGLKVASDNRGDDHNWWVSLTTPDGGVSIVLTTSHENMKSGTMKLYFATSDIAAAHKELSEKGVKVEEVKNDLFGPGSGVKWFHVEDPDGNQVLLVTDPAPVSREASGYKD
jgi:catechol 2,3-dioxygenase-like lactoylglutathione lyase family enzyme